MRYYARNNRFCIKLIFVFTGLTGNVTKDKEGT
jgi:hypothetical protein